MPGFRIEYDFSPLNRLLVAIPTTFPEMIQAEADEAATDMKQSIDTPYPPASSPGEPPHKRSGALQSSVEVVMRRTATRAIASLNVNAPHTKFLEKGTLHMRARPFIAPAFRRTKQRIGRVVSLWVKRSVKR